MKTLMLIWQLIASDPVINERYTEYAQAITDASEEFNIPIEVLSALLYEESKFDKNARSHTGVRGIAQITGNTARRYGIDPLDPIDAIFGMARILRHDFDLLPNHYSDYDKFLLTAFAFNRGRGTYFRLKRKLVSRGKKLSVDNFMKLAKNDKFAYEGYNYVKRLKRRI